MTRPQCPNTLIIGLQTIVLRNTCIPAIPVFILRFIWPRVSDVNRMRGSKILALPPTTRRPSFRLPFLSLSTAFPRPFLRPAVRKPLRQRPFARRSVCIRRIVRLRNDVRCRQTTVRVGFRSISRDLRASSNNDSRSEPRRILLYDAFTTVTSQSDDNFPPDHAGVTEIPPVGRQRTRVTRKNLYVRTSRVRGSRRYGARVRLPGEYDGR